MQLSLVQATLKIFPNKLASLETHCPFPLGVYSPCRADLAGFLTGSGPVAGFWEQLGVQGHLSAICNLWHMQQATYIHTYYTHTPHTHPGKVCQGCVSWKPKCSVHKTLCLAKRQIEEANRNGSGRTKVPAIYSISQPYIFKMEHPHTHSVHTHSAHTRRQRATNCHAVQCKNNCPWSDINNIINNNAID